MGPEGRERLPRLSEEEITDATPCLRAAGEMLEADRISGSLFLARNRATVRTRRKKVLRFPTICSLPRFRVLLPVGSLGRFAQAQFTVTRKWPQAEFVVIRNSQAVPGRCSRHGLVCNWRLASEDDLICDQIKSCPHDQIQSESRRLFSHPSAVGHYG